jgi:hypothetical protein
MTATPAILHPMAVPAPTASPSRRFPPGTPLEWLVRYLPLKQHLTGGASASLIEVGSGARGIAAMMDDAFVGIDVRLTGEVDPHMYPFSYEGGRIPFQNGAFHTVVSVDTLERVPAPNRIDFLKELLRIAASRTIIAFSSDSGRPHVGDLLRPVLDKLGVRAAVSAHEPEDLGRPRARDVEAILNQLDDWTWRQLPAPGEIMSLLVGLADAIPGAAPLIDSVVQDYAAEVEAWIGAGAFGPVHRKIYLIERRHPRVPLVDLGNPATLINAITCPNCEGETRVVAPGVRCLGCGASFTPTDDGIFRLHRTAVASRPDATPGLTFALRPDWSNPDWLMVVHNYLHAFPDTASHRLWITFDPQSQQAATVLEKLRPLMAPFGAQPFAEIYLSETPPEPGVALPLSSDSAHLFDYTSEWFRGQAQSAAQPHPQPASRAKLYW